MFRFHPEVNRSASPWGLVVFDVRTVVKMLQRMFPTTYLHFARIYQAIGTPAEKPAVESVYQTLEPMNFSKRFLEKIAANNPTAISVLAVRQVFWSDMGSPERVAQVLELLGQRQATPKPAPARRDPPRSLDRARGAASMTIN